jgi:predicted nucleic acid-binding protein
MILNYLLEKINLTDDEKIKSHMQRAEEIMKPIDIKDSPFIAACLAVGAGGIVSFDEHFKRQTTIKVFDVNELFSEVND